jgi:hypothetical protein
MKENKEEKKGLLALSVLFDNNKEAISSLFNFNFDGAPTCMSAFQIRRFVLNRREFPTDFAQFQQAKLELYQRIQILFDLYFQFREANAQIKLAEGKIEQLEKEPDGKIKEANIELQKIEIEKNKFKIINIKKQAMDKLNEMLVFGETYKKFKKFDEMKPEELAKHEEESWRIKSAYFLELHERYGLTPSGFLKLPHENGGLKALIDIQQKKLNPPKGYRKKR